MTAENRTPSDEHVNEIIAEYLRAVEAGREADPEEFVGRHPEMAVQ
jgi:hypothetical protein